MFNGLFGNVFTPSIPRKLDRILNRNATAWWMSPILVAIIISLGPSNLGDTSISTYKMLWPLALGPLAAIATFMGTSFWYYRQATAVPRKQGLTVTLPTIKTHWLRNGLVMAALYWLAAMVISWMNVNYHAHIWWATHFGWLLFIIYAFSLTAYWMVLRRLVRNYRSLPGTIAWFVCSVPGMWLMASWHNWYWYNI